MQCLVKATTGNRKQRYHTLAKYARLHQRSRGDKAKVMNDILVLYSENTWAKQNNSTLKLTEFLLFNLPWTL